MKSLVYQTPVNTVEDLLVQVLGAAQEIQKTPSVALAPSNLAGRCVNGCGLMTFKVSWQVGGTVGMVNPLEKKDTVEWEGEWESYTKDVFG